LIFELISTGYDVQCPRQMTRSQKVKQITSLTSKSKKIQDGGRPPSWKFQIAITLQWVMRSTSCLILGWGFWGWRIEWHYFGPVGSHAKWRPTAILD